MDKILKHTHTHTKKSHFMSEEGTDHLELELQRFVSYFVGAGTRILAL